MKFYCLQLYKEKRLCLLGIDFSNLEIFSKMLTVTSRRVHLLQSFQVIVLSLSRKCTKSLTHIYFSFLLISQSLIDHGVRVEEELSISYTVCYLDVSENPAAEEKLINLGLRIGGFFSDAGWYAKSEQVLLACKQLCLANNSTPQNWCRTLECCRK